MKILTSLALAAALAACSVADAAPPPMFVQVEALPAPADSACQWIWWPAVADSLGPAESYAVEVTSSDTTLAPHTRWTVTDHQTGYCVQQPAPGDSVVLTVFVASQRRGITGEQSRPTEWRVVRGDVAPPPPDSVVVTPVDSADNPGDPGDPIPFPHPDGGDTASAPTGPVIAVPDTGGTANPNSPAGDVDADSLPLAVLFAAPRAESPRFDFARYTFTDFCHCNADAARSADRYDEVLSGDPARWLAINPTIGRIRYVLLWSTLDEANSNADDLPNRYQWDMRAWFSAHPEYDMERAFLHRADSADMTPADSAHRLHPYLWSTNRFVGNPLDPGWRAYTLDRFRRMAADPLRTGLMIDEMDDYNLGRFVAPAREFAGQPASVWQDAIVSQLAELGAAIAPKMLQINPAGYGNRALDVRMALAAGAVHLETMNRATQELPSVWTLVDSLVRRGVYVDMVSLEAWGDFHGGSSKLSRESYYPRGNESEPVTRAKLVQLASYYMVADSGAHRVGAQLDNVRAPLTPDSVDLPVYSLDVGVPVGPRSVWLDTRDALRQVARVFRRDFTRATVLIRPVTYWADTVLTDTTAVPVSLPDGEWSMVMAQGDVVPVDSLSLRLSEAAILIRRQ